MRQRATGPEAWEAKWRSRLATPAYFDQITEDMARHGVDKIYAFTVTSDEYPTEVDYGPWWRGVTSMIWEVPGQAAVMAARCIEEVHADRNQGWRHSSSWIVYYSIRLDLSRLGRRTYDSLYHEGGVEDLDPRISHPMWWRELQRDENEKFELLRSDPDGAFEYRLQGPYGRRGLRRSESVAEFIRFGLSALSPYWVERFRTLHGYYWVPEVNLSLHTPGNYLGLDDENLAIRRRFWADFPVDRLTAKCEEPFERPVY